MKSNYLLLAIILFSNFSFSQTYTNAESAEYDPVNDQWLVSNANSIIADDGQGNLTFFGTGQARTGMEVIGDILFALDNPDLIGYDLQTGDEIMRLTIPNANFLNGLTTNGSNKLYITDFTDRVIYEADVSDIMNPSFNVFVANTINAPNGIVYDEANNRLIYVCWGGNAAIRAVDLATQQVSLIINSGIANLDGIDDDADGNYYVSSWTPARITKYNADFSESSVVPTPPINQPADIGYNKETDIIAIPTFVDVIFYDNSNPTGIEELEEPMIVSPNPTLSNGIITLNLDTHLDTQITLLDINGKQIVQWSQFEHSNTLSLEPYHLKSGMYFIQLASEDGIQSIKLILL